MDMEPGIQFSASLQKFISGHQESVNYSVEGFREFVFGLGEIVVGHIVSYNGESLSEMRNKSK